MRKKKVVLDHLKERFEEKGKDFYFKSGQLSRNLGISKYIIGRIVMSEAKNADSEILVIKKRNHGSSLFKTELKCGT